MCIRDRLAAEHVAGLVAGSLAGQRVDHPVLGGLVGTGLDPVSYTHLRAHETVLDLVCRLLLEKKKTIRHNTNRMSPKIHEHSDHYIAT